MDADKTPVIEIAVKEYIKLLAAVQVLQFIAVQLRSVG